MNIIYIILGHNMWVEAGEKLCQASKFMILDQVALSVPCFDVVNIVEIA